MSSTISNYSGTIALSILTSYSRSSTSSSLLSAIYSTDTSDSTSSTTTTDITKLTPWDSSVPTTDTKKLATDTLYSSSLFTGGLNGGAGSADKDEDDRTLYLLYNAVNKLKALSDYASSGDLSSSMLEKIQARIESGLAEIQEYVSDNGLDSATLISGKKYSSMKTDELGISTAAANSYTTDVLATGDYNTVPTSWTGDVKFSISITEDNTTQSVDIDLSEMGTTTRSVGNVANFINQKLEALGYDTRFSRVQTTTTSSVTGKEITQQSLKVSIGSGETVSFGAASDDTETALYVAGAATYTDSDDDSDVVTASNYTTKDNQTVQSVLSRIDVSDSGSTETVSKTAYTATDGYDIEAMTTDSDGNLYFIATVAGTVGDGGITTKDDSDVVLQKVDSTGNVVWSRSLGSESSATGYSIAVSDDGKIAIAGSVDGLADSSASVSGNGIDSFVALYDDKGQEVWYHQKGASGTDEAIDVEFDNSGNVVVLGQTTKSYGSAETYGGTDVYVQSIAADGTVNYTKSVGTTGNDTAIGLEVSGDQVYVAWNADGTEGHISRLESDSGDFAAADYITSDNDIAKISAFDIDDDGNVIVAGNETATGVSDQIRGINMLTGNTTLSLDMDGETIRTISVDDDLINVALDGTTNELAEDTTKRQTLLKGYNIDDGSQVYSVAALGEANSKVSVVSIEGQSESLQAMGLPQGEINNAKITKLTDLTGVRAGEYFYVSIDGKSDKKITISDSDTMLTLQTKLQKIIGSKGTVTLGTNDGAKYLKITADDGTTIELKAGDDNSDALSQLGLDEGVITEGQSVTAALSQVTPDSDTVVALELPSGDVVDVSDTDAATNLSTLLSGVLTRIRTAYRAISNDEDMVTARRKNAISSATNSSSSSSSYMTSYYNTKASEYSAALAKLSA